VAGRRVGLLAAVVLDPALHERLTMFPRCSPPRTQPLLVFALLLVGASVGTAQTPEPPAGPPLAPGYLHESSMFAKVIDNIGDRLTPGPGMPKDGFYPEFGYMVTGSGWISLGPGYHHKFADDRGLFETSAALSWRAYKMAQARVEFHAIGEDKLTIGAQGIWSDFTQIHYFGLGRDSLKADQAAYRLQDFDTFGWLRYNLHPVVITGTVGWLDRPSISGPAGYFRAGFADATTLFDETQAPGLHDPAGFLHADVSAAIDTRDQPLHASRGGMYRVSMAEYSDRDTGQFSFQRYEAEAVQMLPLGSKNWVLAMHGWLVGSNTGDNHVVPLYLMPALGGHDTLRGYTNFRFHDRDLLLASVESRWALTSRVELAAFFDSGNVAPRLGDLNLSKNSVGVGVRVHTRRATFGRLDLAHSKEGWQLVFKMDDVFQPSRRSRQGATVPFVP
jgi:hypothetical protein